MATSEADAAVDAAWEALCARVMAREPEVAKGRMMTADALTHAGKVFVFRSRRNGAGLGCKLGAAGDPGALGLSDWRPLQPFRGRAPMSGWYVIGISEEAGWDAIAAAALAQGRGDGPERALG